MTRVAAVPVNGLRSRLTNNFPQKQPIYIVCSPGCLLNSGVRRLAARNSISRLYATARDWVGQLPVRHMWDLFCGVGGFGLHCATPQMQLTGIEIAPEAIACAKQSAAELGLTRLHFQALDSTQFATAQGETPDLVLVNPPRRGIGKPLCDYLAQMAPRFIIYSSCNAQTMAQDIRHLPNYRIQRVQLFDMFPHTAHYEVLALLRRL